ncbi:outer membrane protein [Bartonella sp. B30(2025)]
MNTKWLVTVFAFVFSVSKGWTADAIIHHEPIADITASPVIVSPLFSWEGLYLGGKVGNFSSNNKMDHLLGPEGKISVGKDLSPKLSGFIGGFYAGSNFEFNNGFILGIDTDVLWVNKSDTKAAKPFKMNDDQVKVVKQELKEAGIKVMDYERVQKDDERTNSFALKQKWAGAVRARIGFAAGRVLPYIAGGVSYTQLQDSTFISVTRGISNVVIASGELSDEKKSLVGYTLGGGIDFALTDSVIVRAEYRHSDYGKKKFIKSKYEIAYKTNDFNIGIAYKF